MWHGPQGHLAVNPRRLIEPLASMLNPCGHRIRTDLSATLFLSEPNEYEGGELLVEDTYGVHAVKLPAGS